MSIPENIENIQNNENIENIDNKDINENVPEVPASENAEAPATEEPLIREEEAQREEPAPLCGAVYTPAADGEGYECRSYTDGESPKAYRAPRQSRPSAANGKKRSGGGGKIALIAVLVALTILLSALAGAASAYLLAQRGILPTPQQPSDVPFSPDTGDKTVINIADNPTGNSSVVTVSVPHGTRMTKSQAASAVKDSVVEITTEIVKTGSGYYSQYVTSGAGSGVIISENGYVITNNHVIDEASTISVRLADGRQYAAELIGTDEDYDIAVVRIKGAENEKFAFSVIGNSDSLEVGEEIIVIGNPLGHLGGSVTSGIISAKEREITVNNEKMKLLQTDAAVNPGNSGGGMFNLYGELVGIINAKSSGENIESLGFAIPVNTAWMVSVELMEYGYVRGKPTLGISVMDETDRFHASYYFNSTSLGVYVYEATEESGFKYGDRIISCNGVEISSVAQFNSLIKSMKVGDTLEVKVMRAASGSKRSEVVINATLVEAIPAALQKK